MEKESESNTTILVKLRTRMNDLLRMGVITPDGFGVYQQTVLQLLQEFDRRKSSCFQQAETLRAQASAVEAQGHAFSVCGSILFSIVNGYCDLEEKRIREMAERAANEPPPEPTPDVKTPARRGRPPKNG
jgi:hypothetical protein